MASLRGKVVVVTGAGGGIGRATSLLIAREGGRVVANDIGCDIHGEGRSAKAAEDTVQQVRAAGSEAVSNTDSVASWEGAQRIVECALDTFGRIDAVVNNAGTLFFTPFQDIGEAEWRAIVDTHLNGSFFVSRAAIPHFLKQGSGAFVHITSSSGLFGRRQQAHYAAAKLGLAAMSRTMALEYAGTGVRSNCVGPIAFSRMVEGTNISDEAMAAFRRLRPECIAPMIVYLCTDAAADVNGQIFYVRGNSLFFIRQCEAMDPLTDDEGWTVGKIGEVAMPAFRPLFGSLRGEDEKIISNQRLG